MLSILGNLNTAEAVTELRFSDGRIVRLPTVMLEGESSTAHAGDVRPREADTAVMPLIEEGLEITKRTVPTGRVLLEKTVETYDVTLDEPLAVTSWTVERVPRGYVVETAPSVREEDLTTIYPILEERMVLTKELVLVEEVRVTRESSERRDPQTFTLRREHLDVQRKDLIGL